MRKPGDPLPDTNVHLRIHTKERVHNYPVYFDRVPVVGERIAGPDDMGIFEITDVAWDFEGGFASPPVPTVIAR